MVEVFKTVNFPMAVYSDKIKKGEAIPDGATIGIPNDPSNGGRALLLLAEQKLIEVKDITDVTTSVADITGNPHGYKFLELDAATIPRSLPDVTVAVINANYALPAGLNPVKDSLMVEGAASPYINIFVTKKSTPMTRALNSCKKSTSPTMCRNLSMTTLKVPLPSAGNKNYNAEASARALFACGGTL